MQDLISTFFDVRSVWFVFRDYPVSYVEGTGTIFGLAGVWLAARQHILTWPAGIINIICFFAVFWQVQLYADVLLQIFFFVMSVFGWIQWRSDQTLHIPVRKMPVKQRFQLFAGIIILSFAAGWLMARIHLFLPVLFTKPAAFPFFDSFVATGSVAGTFLLARRYIENWMLWLLVDVIAFFIYWERNIQLIALEFLLFLLLAAIGYRNWKRSLLMESVT